MFAFIDYFVLLLSVLNIASFLVILRSVLPINTTQVADSRDITDIKYITLKDCNHVDLFSDTRKVRAVGVSPQFALVIRATLSARSTATLF